MAASSFKVCLTAVGEPRKIIEIGQDDSLQDLYTLAAETFGKECADLKSGFPPTSITNSATTLVRSVLPNNDRVTVILEGPKKKNIKKKAFEAETTTQEALGSTAGRRSQRAAARAATDSFAHVIKAQDKLMKEQKTSTKRKKPSTTTSPQKKAAAAASRRMAQFPGRRLADGADVGPPEKTERRRQGGPKLNDKDDVSFALLNALESGGGKVGQVLRGAMRNAISRQYDLSRAVTRVSAVQAGKYTIVESDASLDITFDKGLEGRGDFQETVDAIPREALEMVIKGIHASDPESLRSAKLAQVSPRVFWSLLKETNSGRSMDAALQELIPDLDWSFLRRRKHTLSEKAQENLRQLRGTEEEGDLEAATEAVQAVEQAMAQLHQHNQTQRRGRAAEAALARQGDDWCLVTPTEEDPEELEDCTGDATYVAKLLQLGIHNWRQLANANSEELSERLDLDQTTVLSWMGRAQQESIEEVIVEICDNRIDAVEVLIDQARSTTPKDLANWRSMPDMLFETASSLEGLGVSAEDVVTWCQRSHDLIQEYEWMAWYTTPVE